MSFLSDVPPRWTHPALRELRDILVQIYPERDFAKQICAQVGLDAADFPLGASTMKTLWFQLMSVLIQRRRLRALVTLARDDAMAERWRGRLEELLHDEPPVQRDTSPALAADPGWWKGKEDVVQLTLQRQMQQRARYTSVRVCRLIGEIAPSVAYLDLQFGAERFHGTGFLIAADRILTNHHNVFDPSDGRRATAVVADFDYEEGHDGERLVRRCDVETIVSDPARDWVVLALEAPVDRPPIKLGSPFETSMNDTLVIIQHPLGGAKQFAIDYLSVRHVDPNVVQYTADTQKGSSGSPVFNSRMDLVALHHAEAEIRVTVNNRAEVMYRNEGIQIARIMEGLVAKGVPFSAKVAPRLGAPVASG
jgi:endonuclease G